MKYKINGRYRTTEDGRYTIIKDYNIGTYTIKDNDAKKIMTSGNLGLAITFPTLARAKAFVESLY